MRFEAQAVPDAEGKVVSISGIVDDFPTSIIDISRSDAVSNSLYSFRLRIENHSVDSHLFLARASDDRRACDIRMIPVTRCREVHQEHVALPHPVLGGRVPRGCLRSGLNNTIRYALCPMTSHRPFDLDCNFLLSNGLPYEFPAYLHTLFHYCRRFSHGFDFLLRFDQSRTAQHFGGTPDLDHRKSGSNLLMDFKREMVLYAQRLSRVAQRLFEDRPSAFRV